MSSRSFSMPRTSPVLSVLTAAVIFLSLCIPLSASGQTDAEQRAKLEAQLAQIEADIANKRGTLSELQQQSTSLKRDIGILDTKISAAQLQIKQSDLQLRKLNGDITTTRDAIVTTDTKIQKTRRSIGELLRQTDEIDQITTAQVALSGNFTDIFKDVDAFAQIQDAIQEKLAEMRGLRVDLSSKKQVLEEKQDETEQAKQVQVLAKNAIQRDQQARSQVLKQTQGKEKEYQNIIEQQEKTAAQIRSVLFELRDSGAISFGNAYDYAKAASAVTGVRPALILAILTQETDLGQNIGSCYVNNISSGSGVGKNTGRAFSNVMKSPRDTVPFKNITETLGLDWSTTPVSCPQGSGYGGAMGAAQFIPSTWMLYKDRLMKLTGGGFPNPWNGRVAIFATAMLMSDNGANGGTRDAERTAALKYYAGGNWNKSANRFYGDNVMDLADQMQANINILEGR